MKRRMMKSKLHRAKVTQADLHYVGSVTIDKNLLEAADIVAYEQVDIWNVDNGERFTTYAIEGEPGSGVICVNGAAARKVNAGDRVIIATFVDVENEECKTWEPTCVFVNENNAIVEITGKETPGRIYAL